MKQLGYGFLELPDEEILAAHKKVIEQRMATYTPENYLPWEEVKAKVKKR